MYEYHATTAKVYKSCSSICRTQQCYERICSTIAGEKDAAVLIVGFLVR